MRFQRRQLLQTLSFAFGSCVIWSRNQLGIAAQTAIQPIVSPPLAGAALGSETAGGTEMEKVMGIGGFFFDLTIRKLWGFGTSNTSESRSPHRAKGVPFGSKRQDPPLSLLSRRQASISEIPRRSGCSTFESGISTKWRPSCNLRISRSRLPPTIPSASSPAYMIPREIRSNCGNLRIHTLKAKVQSRATHIPPFGTWVLGCSRV
jgi:hypothetical protein